MTALVRWVLGFILAFLLAPGVKASILHSTREPAARIFGYDSTMRRLYRPRFLGRFCGSSSCSSLEGAQGLVSLPQGL